MSTHIFGLENKVIWLTGASRGLGRAMATALANAGARVMLTARSRADLDSLAGEIDSGGGVAGVYPASVADSSEVRNTVAEILGAHGRIDGLVNCAGISPTFSRSETISDDDWQQVIDVNLTGTFFCCREVASNMLERGSGSIVTVSSVHAQAGFERITPYSASKGAIEAMTRGLAVEWAHRGVRVNSLAPGYFDTELARPLLTSRWSERIYGSIPMRRVGDPTELTGSVVFLMSDASAYMTGSTLTVDGGWKAW